MMRSGLVILLFVILVSACGGHKAGSAIVPKPVAYPRIEVPDSEYAGVDTLGVRLMLNAGADVGILPSEDGAWINVGYGTFSSPKLYLTLTDCGSTGVEEVMSNRRERIGLNLGGLSYELVELATPSGWRCEMAVARGSLTTPVQILADNGRMVLSGAAVLACPDSIASEPVAIAPVVDFLIRDMLVMLKGL